MNDKKTPILIIPEIMKPEFPESLETWLKTYSKDNSLNKSPLIWHRLYDDILIPLTIIKFKEYQESKNPEILGECVDAIPELLHHSVIRSQISLWILKSRLISVDLKREDLMNDKRSFIKGLSPRYKKGKKRNINQEFLAKEKLPTLYKRYRDVLKEKFDNFKKEEDRKPYQGDRGRILIETFFPPEPSKNDLAIKIAKKYRVTPNNYLYELSNKSSKPSVIARKLTKDVAFAFWDIDIGERKLATLVYGEIK